MPSRDNQISFGGLIIAVAVVAVMIGIFLGVARHPPFGRLRVQAI
jgi:hypothetical protein